MRRGSSWRWWRRSAAMSGVVALAGTAAGGCDGDGSGPNAPAARRAESIEKRAGDNQNGGPGAELPIDPMVRVLDDQGQPVAGLTVTFTVTGGGGTVTPATVVTDARGEAAVTSWTLGRYDSQTNPQHLQASVDRPSGGAIVTVFDATAFDPCATLLAFGFAQPVAGALTTFDCRYQTGHYEDVYALPATTGQRSLRFSQSSTVFDTFLTLYSGTHGGLLAFSDDMSAASTNSSFHVLLPAGTYEVGASSWEMNATGAYSVSVQDEPENLTACNSMWVVRGVTTTAQDLTATECQTTAGFYDNVYYIYLRAGETLTATMTSAAADPHLYLYLITSQETTIVRQDDNGGGGTAARIQYTAPGAAFYAIQATTAGAGQTGAYTLSVQ